MSRTRDPTSTWRGENKCRSNRRGKPTRGSVVFTTDGKESTHFTAWLPAIREDFANGNPRGSGSYPDLEKRSRRGRNRFGSGGMRNGEMPRRDAGKRGNANSREKIC